MGVYLAALILIAILLHQATYARFQKRYLWHFQRGESAEARENLTWMIRLNPFDGPTYYQRALIYIEQGNWQPAANDLTKAVRWKANYREAYEKRARVYEALGEAEKARADTRRAKELDLLLAGGAANGNITPRQAQYFNQQIKYLTKRIDEAEARRAARSANTTSPDKRLASLYKERADFFWRLKDDQRCAEDMGKVIEYDPNNPAGYAVRGSINAKEGNAESAIQDLTEAIRLNPTPQGYYLRAYCHYRLRNDNAALSDTESAIRLDPNAAAYYELLGGVYFRKGEYEKSLEAERKAFQTAKQDVAKYRAGMADAHFALGSYDEALREYTLAYEPNPDVIRYIAGLALARHALGNLSEAHDLWHKLISKDERYADSKWVTEQYEGMTVLAEAARALIASLEPPAAGT